MVQWWRWWWWCGTDGVRIVAVYDTNATFFQPCKLMLAFKVQTQTSCHIPYNANVSNVSAINMIHNLWLCLMLDHILHKAFIVFMRWSCFTLGCLMTAYFPQFSLHLSELENGRTRWDSTELYFLSKFLQLTNLNRFTLAMNNNNNNEQEQA